MNDTSATASATGESLLPSGIDAITTVHFVFMALVALFAIGILVYGIRRKRRRDAAEEQVAENADAAGVPIADEAAKPSTPAPRETPAAPPSSAPVTQDAGRPAPIAAASAEPDPVAPPPPAEPVAVAPPPVAPAPPPLGPDPLQDEPIPAAAPLDASPATLAADEPAAPAAPVAGPGDGPVTQLKGLGPKVAARLAELGITTVGQIAALSDAEATALDADLGTFRGRMARDRWIEQARLLAAGDRAGFEAVFGRL